MFVSITSGEDTRFISVELGGINGDGNRTKSSDSIQKVSIAVFRQLSVTINSNFNSLCGVIESTSVAYTLVRSVRVLVFRGKTESLSITET